MKRMYWWICARDETGKRYLIFGSDRDETDARTKGLEILGGMDFTLKQFPTREISSASRMMKFGILDKSHDLKGSTQRMGHTKSIRRRTGRSEPQRGIYG